MVVEINEQLAVLLQPLVEPGALLVIELDEVVIEGSIHLAHALHVTLSRGLAWP